MDRSKRQLLVTMVSATFGAMFAGCATNGKSGSMPISFDQTPERNATPEKLERYLEASVRIDRMDYDGTFRGGEDERLCFISFDGVRNDRYSSDPNYVHTNPDVLEEMVREADQVKSYYIPGLGTERGIGPLQRLKQVLTGLGTEKKAEEAYLLFSSQVQQWHAENSNVEVHISTAGFGPGAGSQRHFANLLDQRGVPEPDGDGYLIPPKKAHQDAMMIFDSVVRGQKDTMVLGIPASVKNVVHLVANNEHRKGYALMSVVDPYNPDDPGIFQFGLPGAHGDVGGGYEDPEGSPYSNNRFGNGLSARALELAFRFLVRSGVPLGKASNHQAL